MIEAGEKYSDRGFTETSYEYATKCLNMLVHDICAKNDSYIVRDFRKDDVLTPQNIIDIRRIFGEIVSKDDDINISALQKYSLYQAVSNTEISYPDNFDYYTCLSFLKKLSQIFNWSIYEKGTLGKGDRLNYYAVILLQWMEGHGLHEIIRGAISHYQEQGGRLVSYDPTYHLEKYNGSANHKNQVINEAMKDIEQIINYKFSMYFLRFSEAIIRIRGERSLINDWYEYVEYGRNQRVYLYNAGVMMNGRIYSVDVTPQRVEATPLKDILETGQVDEHYFLRTEDMPRWTYSKGAKREKRQRRDGSQYYFSEGSVQFPESLDKPSRTMLTSESQVGRTSHVVQDPMTGRLRVLTPIECERLNGFPDNWTDTGMPERMQYYCMGNALVVPLVKRIGDALLNAGI